MTKKDKYTDLNQDFVQLYRSKMDVIDELLIENAIAARVWLFVMKYMDKKNALQISVNTLAKELNVSRQTIWKANKLLKEKEIIQILRYSGNTIYTMSPEIAWTTSSEGKKYCLFETTTYISKDEVFQEDLEYFNHSEDEEESPIDNLMDSIKDNTDKSDINAFLNSIKDEPF